MIVKKKNKKKTIITKKTNKDMASINKSKGTGRINASKQIKHRKRILIKYLVAGYSIEDASEKMKISKRLANKWLNQKEVIEYLENKISETINIESKKRRNKYEFLHSEVYDAIMEKVVTGNIKKMSVKNLLKIFNDISKEIREEDPKSPANSKNINHKVSLSLSEELVALYDNANSKKFLDKPSFDDKIVEIDVPSKNIIKKDNIEDAEIENVIDQPEKKKSV